jgi:hypothetical protein
MNQDDIRRRAGITGSNEWLALLVIPVLFTGIDRRTVLVSVPVTSTGMTFGVMADLTRLFFCVA